MATYFDPTDSTHLALLPVGMRQDSDLATIAAQVEADVIGFFTKQGPYINFTNLERFLENGIVTTEVVGEDVTATGSPSNAIVPHLYVYLKGYKADANDANVDPNLKAALRRTIAEVIRWRMTQWKRELGVQQAGKGKDRTMFSPDAYDPFPQGWDRWLIQFRADDPLWSF